MKWGWALCVVCACGNSPSSVDGGLDASADATEAGCVVTGDWSCVGKESLPPVSATTIDQPLVLYDGSGSGVDVGLPIKACAITDTSCATPVVPTQTTDANGKVLFPSLPTGARGFDGYLEVDSPGDLPNLNFVNPPLFATFSAYNRVFYSNATVNDIVAAAGVTQDPSLGILGIEVHDCSQYPGNVACGTVVVRLENPVA